MTSSEQHHFYTLDTTVSVEGGLKAALDLIFEELKYVVGNVNVRVVFKAYTEEEER